MPSRIIKESITTSESLAGVSADAERLFWRLVVKADDYGLYYGNPRILASMCFPLDPPKEQRIRAWLAELIAGGMVGTYTSDEDGKQYLKLLSWDKHQQTRAKKSKYPLPVSFDSTCLQVNGNQPKSKVPVTDPAYLKYTFGQDDRRNPEVSDVCLKYVQNWDSMKADNIGILFYGDVGTGKSFLACCIANALLGRLVSVSVTNFPRILNTLQGFDDERQKRIDRLQQYSLLVIDDLGVERDTTFSVEQVYNVIDTRARSGKPLIVTTNLSMKDLQNPPSLAHSRIYDRVLEMCPIRLKLTGDSRRVGNANDRKDKARRLLDLEGA